MSNSSWIITISSLRWSPWWVLSTLYSSPESCWWWREACMWDVIWIRMFGCEMYVCVKECMYGVHVSTGDGRGEHSNWIRNGSRDDDLTFNRSRNRDLPTVITFSQIIFGSDAKCVRWKGRKICYNRWVDWAWVTWWYEHRFSLYPIFCQINIRRDNPRRGELQFESSSVWYDARWRWWWTRGRWGRK